MLNHLMDIQSKLRELIRANYEPIIEQEIEDERDLIESEVSAVESKPASDGRIKTGHFFD